MILEMNVCIFSGSTPLNVFAKASILMNCKIQTMCLNTSITVIFTPPEAMDEDCVKIVYYHHENFTICQRVVEMRMNERNASERIEEIVELVDMHLEDVVYGYSHGIYEVGFYTNLSLLQKFEIFFEKIQHDSSIAFLVNQMEPPLITLFVKAFLRQLGRKPPIDAKYDPDIVQTWLSNNEPRMDLIAHSSALNDTKAEFIINLSPYFLSHNQISGSKNATTRYSHIQLPFLSADEVKAIIFLSSEKNKQSDEAYPMHLNIMEKYLRRT